MNTSRQLDSELWEINLFIVRIAGVPDPVSNPTNHAAAMTAFQLVTAADAAKLLMLDFRRNHTAPDVLGQKVDIFAAIGNPDGWSAATRLKTVPQFFSTDGGRLFGMLQSSSK